MAHTAGIAAFGAYIPFLRLSREAISKAWGEEQARGERAVANYDEDSITMAVAAANDCLTNIDRNRIDELYFASCSPPYREKQCATIIAAALDIPRNAFTTDFSNSVRAGTNAIKTALDAVKAGKAKNILVTIADCRLGAPKSDEERNYGDGACAFLVGNTKPIATVQESYTHSDEFFDVWRTESDTLPRKWETAFILSQGYVRNMVEAGSNIMKKCNFSPKEINRACLYAPDLRQHLTVARALGFEPQTQVQDPMINEIGNTGCAFAPMIFLAALEKAKPGDRILVINYGDGCDAFIWEVTEDIGEARVGMKGISGHLASKMMLDTYEKYLSFRQLVPAAPSAEPSTLPIYAPALWRERGQLLSLHASRCRECGTVTFPIQRVCYKCRSKDNFNEIRLSDKPATLFTYSKDNLAPSPDPPLVRAIVDFEGGGRLICQMTDRDPDKVQLGMPVEMTFRKLQDSGGIHNYFWKCRPRR